MKLPIHGSNPLPFSLNVLVLCHTIVSGCHCWLVQQCQRLAKTATSLWFRVSALVTRRADPAPAQTLPQLSIRPHWLLPLAAIIVLTLPPTLRAADDLADLEEQAFKRAAAVVDPVVVRLETVGGLERVGEVSTVTGPTTGLVVSADGYILTSSFNFAGKPSSILVALPDGRRLPARLVATDRLRMLTLIKVDAENLPVARPAPNEEMRVGQWAIAVGRTYDGPLPNLSIGIVSALGRIWGKAIQTDAKISPVNYGGALIDLKGRILGILVPLSPDQSGEVAGVEWYDGGIGFAIPLTDALAAAERLKAGKDLHPGLLGITVRADSKLDGRPELDRVRFGSPADEAGLKVGDLLAEVAGKPIRRYSDLQTALGTKYAGDKVTIAVTRGQDRIDAEVTLVDKLVPYDRPFLGVLPIRNERDTTREPGVIVRALLANSPAAAAGLARGDRIITAAGQPGADAKALETSISRLRPEQKLALAVVRGGEQKTIEVTLGSYPAEPPAELPADLLKPPAVAGAPDGPKTGRRAETVAAHERDFWAYIPDDYSPANSYGLVVWLHPTGDTQEAEQLERWRAVCTERGLIFLAPKAKELGNWSPTDAVFIKELIERFQQEYSIDARRITVHGMGSGGLVAYFLANKYRELVRAVCTVGSPLRQAPGESDPDFRLQYFLAAGKDDPVFPQIAESQTLLESMKVPVTTLFTSGPSRYPEKDGFVKLVLWLDCLDRL